MDTKNTAQPASPPTTPSTRPGEKRKRSTRNLLLRGSSAIGALALIYYCLWWDSTHATGWAWALLVAIFCVPGLREFYRLAEGSGTIPFRQVGYIAGPVFILASEWDLSGGSAAVAPVGVAGMVMVAAAVAAMLIQLTRRSNEQALQNVATTMFGLIYCALLPGLFLHLRHLALSPIGWPMHGVEFAVTCIFVSKVSDVGALLTGSMWGKHKMIPRLSPGKTWEGALGGLLFSVFLLQFMTWIEPRMALASLGRGVLLLLSILLAIGGMAGDLIESAFKRSSQQKDAGTGVPGFGGILDLTDSLMIAAPIMYFFLLACGARYIH